MSDSSDDGYGWQNKSLHFTIKYLAFFMFLHINNDFTPVLDLHKYMVSQLRWVSWCCCHFFNVNTEAAVAPRSAAVVVIRGGRVAAMCTATFLGIQNLWWFNFFILPSWLIVWPWKPQKLLWGKQSQLILLYLSSLSDTASKSDYSVWDNKQHFWYKLVKLATLIII